MEYYLYKHVRLDSGKTFYVGKGKKKRAWSLKSRNSYWKNIVKAVGYEVEIIETGLSEESALLKEQEMIKFLKSIGECEANMTLGGEGTSGLSISDKNKKMLSEKFKGKSRNPEIGRKISASKTGTIFSDEHRTKLSKSHLGRSPSNKGTKMSDEQKRKISETLKSRSLER